MAYRVTAKHIFGRIRKTYKSRASAVKHAKQMRKGSFTKVRIRKLK